ncbi:MAG: acetyl-CoA carboxylase carboxyltransferase subunit alpha [Gammaproteobacteria bacterium]|jgi:acetyl-CoA carboxylase carboxyl transferase subunit alpha|nr:acetyl-CoA carboxylase carboxyltransferase subunit alpha [Gammaproteobacteria bacterium]
MNLDYLLFEQEIARLEAEIQALRETTTENSTSLSQQIKKLEEKSQALTKEIYAKLSVWESVQVARHPRRPYVLDYIPLLFTDFQELHGDRHFADDGAIVGGLAKFKNNTVMVIGHQKGRTTQEKIARNFGMPRPEGYRKAQRLMELAGKFGFPVITFIDTAGAYPGIDAEERNQSEAIAKSLQVMARLPVPIISIVTGEGGSGGALAIGVSDRIAMLQYSIYSVITPEGCASILWKDASHASIAAEAMGVSAAQIEKLGIIDAVLQEPIGGAHRDPEKTALTISEYLQKSLIELQKLSPGQLIQERQEKLLHLGSSL